ncbi:MAG: type II toxin-antitoxin system HigB family toxin [Okeania sp. SIO3B3]|nr:type II toxin-antitoxin system HigB family toxin [Okeania sp. SIO3B3]
MKTDRIDSKDFFLFFPLKRGGFKPQFIGNFTVFNINGNRYRLIVSIDYKRQLIYIKYILTHGEYDKEYWKNDPCF